ncbi:MAG: signal recognition particle-docking protein FtsY [Desulfobacterales bacterium]
MAFNWFRKKNKNEEAEAVPTAGEKSQIPAPIDSDAKHPLPESAENVEPEDLASESPSPPLGPAAEEAEPLPGAETLTEPESTEGRFGESGGNFFQRLKKGLSKTRYILTTDIDRLFTGDQEVGEDMLEDLEELLITADIGVRTTMDIVENISKTSSKIKKASDLKARLKEELLSLIPEPSFHINQTPGTPFVVMIVGVNGVGKTTTIGKLASKDTAGGKKVMIAASDTFRAAAVEQLDIWARRAGADIVKHRDNADPAAVAFDAVASAKSRGMDRVYIDTAGRLHTKTNLMEELKKIKRSVSKQIPEAPHEVLLVLDATTGQNALSQAEIFTRELGISGIILTKLDGTAKGGIVFSICNTLNIPLKYIGVGEAIEDLQDFEPENFVNALL